MSIKALITHIQELVSAQSGLAGLNLGLVNYGVPTKLPAIYIDGLTFLDDKLNSHTFNLCYVTTDLSIEQLDYAKLILAALQGSPCVQAQQLLPRPEPENKRNRWIIPCVFFPRALKA
ncbi:hypothetical protein [Novosphingobium sp. TCA1]|jgi:hypothetical protein|uniref:hypothetical protein n=1 Tax=Novosphingobium sp. TCA1 TaxID=2682474 RepID=UPI00130A5497|nr:hypothetical protein [Novosphingobium sp. TCA1]GFE72374.1 hypothetical protein NTCA1_00230 [Novosphingobium sp. TCA1]